jgi:hypothetical protein
MLLVSFPWEQGTLSLSFYRSLLSTSADELRTCAFFGEQEEYDHQHHHHHHRPEVSFAASFLHSHIPPTSDQIECMNRLSSLSLSLSISSAQKVSVFMHVEFEGRM